MPAKKFTKEQLLNESSDEGSQHQVHDKKPPSGDTEKPESKLAEKKVFEHSETTLDVSGNGPEVETEKKGEGLKTQPAEVLEAGEPEAPEVEGDGFGDFGDFGDGQSEQSEGNEGFGDFANFAEAPVEADAHATEPSSTAPP